MKKKSCLMLAGILGMSAIFTGCGSTRAENAPVQQTESAQSTDTKTSEEAAASSNGYEVATVRWADWGEDYHTGFPDKAAADAGISITWDTILNSDWGDKKAVLMAGGNLPDAFMGSICFCCHLFYPILPPMSLGCGTHSQASAL